VIPATESSAWSAPEQRSAGRSRGRDFAGARHMAAGPFSVLRMVNARLTWSDLAVRIMLYKKRMASVSLRSVAVATAFSVALCATATTVRAQDGATSPSDSLRAAIGREAPRLAAASARPTTWRQPLPPERNWLDRHPGAAGTLIRAAAGTTSRQQDVQQERSWVGRHPALTGSRVRSSARGWAPLTRTSSAAEPARDNQDF